MAHLGLGLSYISSSPTDQLAFAHPSNSYGYGHTIKTKSNTTEAAQAGRAFAFALALVAPLGLLGKMCIRTCLALVLNSSLAATTASPKVLNSSPSAPRAIAACNSSEFQASGSCSLGMSRPRTGCFMIRVASSRLQASSCFISEYSGLLGRART